MFYFDLTPSPSPLERGALESKKFNEFYFKIRF
jgi:hypothetical protein